MACQLIDIFSYGCIVCHVISQQYPDPLSSHLQLTEVEKWQKYINQIKAGPLKQLVMECLDNDPKKRPPISLVCERITVMSASMLYNLHVANCVLIPARSYYMYR